MIAATTLRKGLVLCAPATCGGWKSVVAVGGENVLHIRLKSSRANPAEKRGSEQKSSLFDSMAEHYTNLRWRFATSLTESLPKEQQAELLERLNVNQPKPAAEQQPATQQEQEAEVPSQHSIQEAIAAAKAEEAQRQSAKWEQEKAKLLAEAEAAAKARVENELLIQHRRLAFDKWQDDLKKNDEDKSNSSSTNQAEQQADVVKQDLEEPISVQDHPVLGSAIADLGYKRVHISSVQALKSLPVWKKQRTYRHSRAKSMAQDKMKTLHLGMPGIIALHEDLNGSLSIIDGQHRVGMMAILEEKKGKSDGNIFDLDQILVEVYPEDKQGQEEGRNNTTTSTADGTSTHAQDIFLEINKAEPVKLVDLPGVALTKSDRKTINEGAARLNDAFPEMFSPSQRCRSPHLNVDNLRDALFASDAVKRHNLKTPKALETWMMEQNEVLKAKYSKKDSREASSVPKTALEKAIKYDFFLGLDSSWLYQ